MEALPGKTARRRYAAPVLVKREQLPIVVAEVGTPADDDEDTVIGDDA